MSFTEIMSRLNIFNQIAFQRIAVTRDGEFQYTDRDGIIVYHTTTAGERYRYFL